MSTLVRTVARWLEGFILLYGIYIVAYGHLTPGGGFAGGVLIACGLILAVLAAGRRGEPKATAVFDSVGAWVFLAVACSGLLFGEAFFHNVIATPPEARFHLFSGGTILASNLGIGLKVGCSLVLVFGVLAAFRKELPP